MPATIPADCPIRRLYLLALIDATKHPQIHGHPTIISLRLRRLNECSARTRTTTRGTRMLHAETTGGSGDGGVAGGAAGDKVVLSFSSHGRDSREKATDRPATLSRAKAHDYFALLKRLEEVAAKK